MILILNITNPKDLKQQKNDIYKPYQETWENLRSGDVVSKRTVLQWIRDDKASIIYEEESM
jgi:hypothetical protein